MANNGRSAEKTIKGYYYQFDYSIIKVLELPDDNDTICIEGVEDVDITDESRVVFHQCKCYESSDYVHSKISPAIRQMIRHYASNKSKGYHYHLYGTFQSGQDKFPGVSLSFIKNNVCTYTEKKVPHVLHDELSLNDNDLNDFIAHLTIDVNAESYLKQEKKVIDTICSVLGCKTQEATLYYCNALYKIKQLATQSNESDRTISKAEFINAIKTVDAKFEMWLLHKNGIENFAKVIKKKYFTNFNISPYNRFFIIECDKDTSMSELKTIVIRISEKYSKLSQRAKPRFCPYFCFLGIEESQLIELKKSLANDSVLFSDGYDFRGADFNPSSVVKEPSKDRPTKLRIIDNIDLLNDVYALSQSTIEIYQFYKNQPLYNNDSYYHVKIPFENIIDIVQMI